MRCQECGRESASADADGTCTVCAAQAEREVAELTGDPPVEYCELAGTRVRVTGLPPHVPLADTSGEQPDHSVPGSVLNAPDVEHEFFIRYGIGGA